MSRFPRSFRVSVVAVTAVTTLMAAVAMGLAHYRTQKNSCESDLERLLRLSAFESADRVARWLEERRDSATSIAGSTTLKEELRRIRTLTPKDDEYFLAHYRLKKELDQSTFGHRFIYELTIHDAQTGDVFLASTGSEVVAPSTQGNDRGVAEGRNQLWVSPMVPAEIPLPNEAGIPDKDVPCIFISTPIRDGTEVLGVLRVRARVLDIGDNLLRAASYSDLFEASDTYVVNRDGVLLSPSHFEKELMAAGRVKKRSMLELKLLVPNGDEMTRAFQQSRALLASPPADSSVDLDGYVGVQGRKVVGAWARVDGTDWVCIAEIDHEEAFAPLAQLTRTTLYLSLLIGLIVVGATTWMAARLVTPLEHVAAVARRLADGDRSVRCRMERTDEIGKLADAFDNMADAVDEALTRLEYNAARLAESNQQLESELAERQRFGQELRTANAFLDSVIDNIPTMLFMKDADDLRIVRFNKAGEQLVGSSRDEMLGKSDFDLYPKEEAEFFVAKDREVLKGLKMVEIDEEEILTKTGVRILHTKKIPVCDENGKPLFLLGISEDITEKKQTLEALKAAKEAAESANLAKSDFLANMSHEIRTPMNAIIGMTDLVLDTSLDDAQRDYLTIVSESAESLLSIINQILDFSKIEAGKLELESIDFDVREEVGDTLKSLGLRAHAKQLELAWCVHSDVPFWLCGDPVRLRQMLINLVGNAIKFTHEGEVMVDVQRQEDQDSRIKLHFAVRDTGVGIPEEKREHVFSAFSQADSSTTRQFGGTGLGLAITARIAEAMDGQVWVESELGQGSTFHFTAGFCRGKERQQREEKPDLDGVPVLVVDDNETNRKILEGMLQDWGMSVETVEGGTQAFDVLQRTVASQQRLPLIISDVNMPEMDGFMLAEQLRAAPSLRETSIIMLTSGGRRGDIDRCQELNVAAHLMKPVKQSELLDAILLNVGTGSQAQRVSDDASPETDPHSMPPMKILLAEDGKANQMMAVGLLTRWGHEVTVAENGQEAIGHWQSGSYDVILMDVQMPVLDGFDATRRIRELEAEDGRHIPIVAMTARAMKGDRQRCLAAGMDDYVSKPVRKAELHRALTELTSSKENKPEVDADQSTPVVDWETALETLGGDRKMLRDLVHVTLKEMPVLKRQLEDKIKAEDADATQRIAHTIKGEASAISAIRTQQAATIIEDAAANRELEKVNEQMPRLVEAIDQLIGHCEDTLRAQPTHPDD